MNITAALKAEHTIFLTVFDQIERALPSLTTQAECHTMARMIEGMLQGHAERESNLAFLALDHVLAEKGTIERMHHEHREVDGRLRKVQEAKTCAEARRLLQVCLGVAREHFRLEEKALFPVLERNLKPETLQELGRQWLDRNGAGASGV